MTGNGEHEWSRVWFWQTCWTCFLTPMSRRWLTRSQTRSTCDFHFLFRHIQTVNTLTQTSNSELIMFHLVWLNESQNTDNINHSFTCLFILWWIQLWLNLQLNERFVSMLWISDWQKYSWKTDIESGITLKDNFVILELRPCLRAHRQ